MFNALPLLVTYQVLCTLGRYHSQGEEKSRSDILANLNLGRGSTPSGFSYLHQSEKFWGMGFSALSSICTPYLETGVLQKWSALEFNLIALKPPNCYLVLRFSHPDPQGEFLLVKGYT